MSEEPARDASRGVAARFKRLGSEPSAWPGILGTFGLHLAGFAAVAITQPAFMHTEITVPEESFWLLIGVYQFVYMVPAVAIAAILEKRHLLKGFVIGISFTFIINAGCYGLIALASL